MKKGMTLISLIFLSLLTTMTSCDFLGGIFKTGMGIGVVVTLAVVILIIIIIRSTRRR